MRKNIANGSAKIKDPDPRVSIFNFHYASPPDAVKENRDLRKPIGFDETGFKGTGDAVYRREAWQFLMAGGAVFSNLDYSFTPEHPDGRAKVKDPTPGGGGPELRRQLSVMKKFFDGLDLTHTSADSTFFKAEAGGNHQALGMADRQHDVYVLYAFSGPGTKIALDLPPRSYRVEWIDPHTGTILKQSDSDAQGAISPEKDRGISRPGEASPPQRAKKGQSGQFVIELPTVKEDIAIRIVAQSGQAGRPRE